MEIHMKSRRTWKGLGLAATLGFATLLVAGGRPMQAQQDGGGRSQYAGMEHTAGEVAQVNGLTVTVKTESGTLVQIVTTTNTRILKGRGGVVLKLADLKPGDGVVAIGNLDGPGGTMHAAMLFATDASQLKAMRENLGKTYIAGKVTAIDTGNATLTIERPDHVSQTIQLDETTSIRRGSRRMQGLPTSPDAEPSAGPVESLTMGDMKVGDIVRGTGAMKNGSFVPGQLVIMPPGAHEGGHHRAPVDTPPA
jgi:hypothetical protein